MEHPECVDIDARKPGSNFWLISPRTTEAEEWIDTNVQPPHWHGDAFICEDRHVEDLVEGMLSDGLSVTTNGQPWVLSETRDEKNNGTRTDTCTRSEKTEIANPDPSAHASEPPHPRADNVHHDCVDN